MNPDTKERTISPSTTTIPRLISVVEIIKREYLKTLEITHSRVLSGLYQYNEIGYLEQYESQDGVPSEEDRTQVLAMALEGKNQCVIYFMFLRVGICNVNSSPKDKKSAYMRVTLSKAELPHLIKQGAT